MDNPNLHLATRHDFEAWNRRDWQLLKSFYAPGVLMVSADGQRAKGVERLLQRLAAKLKTVRDIQIVAHPIKMASGLWTVVVGEEVVTLHSGEYIKNLVCTLARWENQKITETHSFQDFTNLTNLLSLGSSFS